MKQNYQSMVQKEINIIYIYKHMIKTIVHYIQFTDQPI